MNQCCGEGSCAYCDEINEGVRAYLVTTIFMPELLQEIEQYLKEQNDR